MKLGQINMVLVGAILAIAFLVVMSITFNKFTDVVVFDDVSDTYCKNKLAAISTNSMGKTGDNLENFFNLNLREFTRKCKTDQEIIDPNKVSSCSYEIKAMTSDTIQTAENCVIYKFLNLARRCWEMNGAGTIDGYNWACFNVIIGETDKTDPIVKIRSRLNTIFQCDGENAGENCNSLKARALSDAQIITVYNAYLDSSKEATKGKLFLCLNEEVQYNTQNLTVILPSGEKLINEQVFNEWYDDILENYHGNVPSRFIDPYLNYSSNFEDQCYKSNFNSEFNVILTNTTVAQTEREQFADDLLAKFCNSRLNPANCISQDTTIDINAKLSSGLSSHITWNEIENVMSVAKIPNSELTYEDYFDDDIELGNNEPIRESSAFQVTYCDGLLPVWSGVVSSYPCGTGKKILLSNDMNSGGARMVNENIVSSCPILSTVTSIIDTGVTRAMTTFCEETDFLIDI